ncbi:PREDICTED: probable myosin-binding protein 4 [Nelumbo nucifera]|uniref:GTD-binding domain-containing protein n=2 Tax=Nelumbo nucifera TaxID=4432 RepID=A0A822XQN4_NELNU|nr:PREDICTED: probable myosin-binding protein 4 [Nelumbo nucifera]XP_010278090.1 PREDICTED: probable myosin-binding protein 4 [Nelumbo nucifera]XP_010278091.1 PREDICTED: probable myosin-binding protein 4 [Nelumbo nucifera]XP_010278092.1 PREDICTED: probable myosin-binding protein 4 [Nelumbo nucifera]DAD19788.1 TPA_asm: hypothetical protein HUJ06_021251 [Nelumbo nucifera]
MATGRISLQVQRDSRGYTTVLASAVLEWLLIFLLFINAAFSYLLTKFARYFELQVPCVLCSRLDHVFGNEQPGFYKDLICSKHKSEISSLVLCHIHGKLADVHEMCEGCLFSLAAEKPDTEAYRLLVGKLGMDTEHCFDQDPLIQEPTSDSLNTKHCSCCNEPWRSRSSMHKFLQTKLNGSKFAEFDLPLPHSIGPGHLHHQEVLKKRRGKSSGSVLISNQRGHGFDHLSHVGYTGLKITSDSESEVHISDDDNNDEIALTGETESLKEEFVAQCVKPETPIISEMLPKSLSNDFIPEKLIHRVSTADSSLLVPHVQLDGKYQVNETNDIREDFQAHSSQSESFTNCSEKLHKDPSDDLTSQKLIDQSSANESLLVPSVQLDEGEPCKVEPSSSSAIEHGLEELNWHQVERKANPSAPPEPISPDVVTASSNAAEAPTDISGANLDVTGTSGIEKTPIAEGTTVCKPENVLTTATEQYLKADQISNDPGSTVLNYMDLSDAYKLAISNRGSQISGMLEKQLSGKDSSRVSEDLKLLLSQISASRGLELPFNEMSPRVYGIGDESKISDSSSYAGMQILQKRISLERNESGLESWDGSIISEFEGESIVDRLKRQVEYDRKSMSALYKELEEERNASAIAANQAMAMITRLQEEKAALHMEALQYLRMMEEQSEYDMEALQKANSLLAEREKMIQDLETELEFYKKKFPTDSVVEEIQEQICDLKGGDMRLEHSDLSGTETSTTVSCNSTFIKKCEGSDNPEGTDLVHGDNDMIITKDPLLDFEDERLYISQCLKKLEKKLYLFSNNGVHVSMCNGSYSGSEAHVLEKLHNEKMIQGYVQEEVNSSLQKDQFLSRGSPPAEESSSPSFGDPLFGSKSNHHVDGDGEHSSIVGRETDLIAFANEMSDLNYRLESLEADQNFLEHSINSLQNEDEGLQFIQEIAHHLRELRRILMRRRGQAVA